MTGPRPGRPDRRRDDAGGVWIRTGVVLGLLVYAGVVVMAAAGFSGAIPLVIVPPVLVGLIGAANLLGGGRDHGRSAGGRGRDRAPLSSSGPNGPIPPGAPPDGPRPGGPGGAR